MLFNCWSWLLSKADFTSEYVFAQALSSQKTPYQVIKEVAGWRGLLPCIKSRFGVVRTWPRKNADDDLFAAKGGWRRLSGHGR